MEEEPVPAFKVVLLGETMTGKTSILERLKTGVFSETLEPTIGVQFYSHVESIGDKKAQLDIWDTAGQERYKAMSTMYYRGAPSAIVVYDISRRETFTGAKKWVHEVQMEGAIGCIIVLCGNKADREAVREVPPEEAFEFAKDNDLHICTEISAKTGQGLREMFTSLSKLLLKQHENNLDESSKSDDVIMDGKRHRRRGKRTGKNIHNEEEDDENKHHCC